MRRRGRLGCDADEVRQYIVQYRRSLISRLSVVLLDVF